MAETTSTLITDPNAPPPPAGPTVVKVSTKPTPGIPFNPHAAGVPSTAPTKPTEKSQAGEQPKPNGDATNKPATDQAGAVLPPTKREESRISRLNRMEHEKRELQQRTQRYEAELAQSKQATQALELAKRDPAQALKALGIDLDAAIMASLGEKPSPEKVAEFKVKEVEKKIQQLEDNAKQAEQRAQEQASRAQIDRRADEFIGALKGYVKADPEGLELCSIHGDAMVDDAIAMTGIVLQQTGQLPNPKHLIEVLEKHYEEEAYEAATKSKRIQARLRGEVQAGADSKKPASSPTLGSSKLDRRTPSTALITDEEKKGLTIAQRDALVMKRAREAWKRGAL